MKIPTKTKYTANRMRFRLKLLMHKPLWFESVAEQILRGVFREGSNGLAAEKNRFASNKAAATDLCFLNWYFQRLYQNVIITNLQP